MNVQQFKRKMHVFCRKRSFTTKKLIFKKITIEDYSKTLNN